LKTATVSEVIVPCTGINLKSSKIFTMSRRDAHLSIDPLTITIFITPEGRRERKDERKKTLMYGLVAR
jgi:hypothetical protein